MKTEREPAAAAPPPRAPGGEEPLSDDLQSAITGLIIAVQDDERWPAHCRAAEKRVALVAAIRAEAASLRARVEALERESEGMRRAAGMELPTQRVLRYVSWEAANDLLGLARDLIDHERAGKLAKMVCDLLMPGSIVPVPRALTAEKGAPGDDHE